MIFKPKEEMLVVLFSIFPKVKVDLMYVLK